MALLVLPVGAIYNHRTWPTGWSTRSQHLLPQQTSSLSCTSLRTSQTRLPCWPWLEAPQVKREFMKFHLSNKHADMLAKDQVEEIERNFIDYRWSVKHDIDFYVPTEKQGWITDEYALAFLMRCVGWAEADPHFPAAVFRDDRYLEFRFAFAALGFFIRRVSTRNFADLDAVKSTPLAEFKRRWLSIHASPLEDASQQPNPDGSSSELTAHREEWPIGIRLPSDSVLRVLSIFSSDKDIGWFKDWFDLCLEDYSC
ncbi:hypothetical protein SCUP515_11388 [Seiridium cupressi]